ncbi:glycosyltransferase, partial [bacterium]|nr:glycosyltransferase [bacterium]
MISRLAADRWQVHAVAPDDTYRHRLESLGATYHVWPCDRRSMNPWHNILAFVRIVHLYRRIRPDVVHHFTIKPVILGGIAARCTGVPRIVQSVTGLGHAFLGSGAMRRFALALYRLALGGRAITVFQNPADRDVILASGATQRERTRLIRGSGIDPEQSAHLPAPFQHDTVTFLMACRMLWVKGVREFVEAAEIVAARRSDCRFVLLGDVDEGAPDAADRDWLKSLEGDSHVEWLGFQSDVMPALSRADVVVLPSYSEGLPRSLLEGAAAARPMIAAENGGTRELIPDGGTGTLVPPRDSRALADAMFEMAADRDTAVEMGRKAQALVRAEFSLDRVISNTRAIYDGVPADGRVRIAHIITGLGVGGAENMLVRLLEHTDRSRFSPLVVCLRKEGELGARVRELGVPLHSLGMLPSHPSLSGLLRLARLLRRDRVNVVQTWMYHADLAGGIAARLAGRLPVA